MDNQQSFVSELEKELRPLFLKMYSEIKNVDDYWLFCATWGKYFPSVAKQGILFYGRATNGWKDYCCCANADDIFSFLFNRADQVEWMSYNTSRPFVNLIKHVAERYYPKQWNEHIAWSNVCKVAPNTTLGTPSLELWDEQYWHMVSMMEVELRILSPKVVIFITGTTAGEHWDSPLFEIDKYKNLESMLTEQIVWGIASNGFPLTTKGGVVDDTIFIFTDRPEMRPIEPHANAIIELIEKLSGDNFVRK